MLSFSDGEVELFDCFSLLWRKIHIMDVVVYLFSLFLFGTMRYTVLASCQFFRRDASICIARISYGNVAGWLAGCLSQLVLYQND